MNISNDYQQQKYRPQLALYIQVQPAPELVPFYLWVHVKPTLWYKPASKVPHNELSQIQFPALEKRAWNFYYLRYPPQAFSHDMYLPILPTLQVVTN